MSYSKEVIDHYENPRNVGSLDKNDENVGTGIVGAPACLAGDTRVATADGRLSVPIKQLAEEGADVPVYAWTPLGYRAVYGIKPRCTRENAQTVIISFDDGSSIVCTPDHGFYRYSLNGRVAHSRVNAEDLKVGDSLRPFVRREDSGYYRIYSGSNYEREHRLIARLIYGDIKGKHVHHKNENGLDNRAKNLEVITGSSHNSYHMKGDRNPMRRFPERRFGSFSAFKQAVGDYNHKVISVSPGPTQDVYCMTVDQYGCFAVVTQENRGVLVSNCGDVMKLQVKISEDGIIEDAKFKTFGCGSAIASSSLVSEWVKGKSVDEALTIKNSDIVKELSLPPVKIHCSVLAEDAIKAAIADYKKKKSNEG